MKKKLLVMSMTICLVLAIVAGATLAYFTDKDYVKNEFTIGDVDIDLWEIVDENGTTVGKDTDEKNEHTYRNLFAGDYATKEVHITNNSKTNDVYVRVTVVMNHVSAINDAIDEYYESQSYTPEQIQAVYDEVFDGWGVNYSKREEYSDGSRMWMDSRVGEASPVLCNIDTIARITEDYYRIDCANHFMTEEEKEAENGDGIFDVNWDDLSVSYYVNAAKVDQRAYVFYLKLEAEQDYVLFNGLQVPTYFTQEQAAMFNGLTIDVYADAIQTVGFDTFEDAFNALEDANPLGWWNED